MLFRIRPAFCQVMRTRLLSAGPFRAEFAATAIVQIGQFAHFYLPALSCRWHPPLFYVP